MMISRHIYNILHSLHGITKIKLKTRAVLSQGGPRDAAVNFDKKIYNGIARFLCHSTAFLYSPTSATVQMMKSLTVP